MSTYNFFYEYRGPLGPHLSHLTEFTKTRDEKTRGGEGIHMRNWSAMLPSMREKQNTCKAAKPETKRRLIAALSDHCKRHPRDQQSSTRLHRLMTQS